ncbi:MAG: hypothetical protein AB1467_05960 [Candidatus Diapherotrites archaeon]
MQLIAEKLGAIYGKVENAFYGVLDFLDSKGIPVYALVDPLEERGIPFFPLFIALIVILIGGFAAFTLIGTGIETTLQLSIHDIQNKPLNEVNLTVYDDQGNTLLSQPNAEDSTSIKLPKVKPGAKISLSASKQGYETVQQELEVKGNLIDVSIAMQEAASTITPKIRFIDAQTKTAVPYVQAHWSFNDNSQEGSSDENGLIELTGIPLNEDILLEAIADGYEDYSDTIQFTSDTTKVIELIPVEGSLTGQSTLIVKVIDAETKQPLDKAIVQVFDEDSGSKLYEIITEQGVFSEKIDKGTVVRVTAEKDGYVKYDSSEEKKFLTLRNDTEDFGTIELEKGGSRIQVNVYDKDSKMLVIDAQVALFNDKGEIIDFNATEFGGFVEFKNLDPNSTYYIGTSAENYLTDRTKLIPKALQSINIELEKITADNSGKLNVYVNNSLGKPAGNAILNFYEEKEGEMLLLGIPAQKTSSDGAYSTTVKMNQNITVRATKEGEEGQAQITIEKKSNDVLIEMQKAKTAKTIKFFDEKGIPIIEGLLTIKSQAGEVLYDGNLNAEVIFDTAGNDFVLVQAQTPDGKTFEELVDTRNKDELSIEFNKAPMNELAPKIEFLGIFDLEENEIEGLTKGEEAILKFETQWIKGNYSGGVHIRVGPDNIKYIDSQYAGITGFEAPTQKYFLGRTYSPTPAPGAEGLDYSNRGQTGAMNKFLELYFNNPEGTKIIKVKVQARETIKEDKINLSYRAWSKINGQYNRNPADTILNEEEFNESKQGLYAETTSKEIKVFTTKPSCSEDLCANYLFYDASGRSYSTKEFIALKDNAYALEIELNARKTVNAIIKASTNPSAPKIAFTGKEEGEFTEIADNNNSDTSIETTENVTRAEAKKIRFYFKAKELGTSSIKVQAIAGSSSTEEDLYFKVFQEKEMSLTTIPSELSFGKDFEIQLKGKNENEPVKDAEIKIFNSEEKLVEHIVGDGKNGTGANGRYKVNNNLGLGSYRIEATSPYYTPISSEITIGKEDAFTLAEKISLFIPAQETSTAATESLSNNSGEDIDNISIEIIKEKNFPSTLEVTAETNPFMNKGEKAGIELKADYSGDPAVTVHGEADLIITGEIKGKFTAKAKSKIIIEYNKKLDGSCLQLDKTELKEYLIGQEGNSKDLELTIKNNCGMPLTLKSEITPKTTREESIEFILPEVRLKKDETQTIKIGVQNRIRRTFDAQENKDYTFFLKSFQITKSLPLTIILWDEKFSLSAPAQLVFFLTQSKANQKAVSFPQFVYVRNTGFADIKNLTLGIDRVDWQNVGIRILPEQAVPLLAKSQNLNPPYILVAEGDSAKNKFVKGRLLLNGFIEGKSYLLRTIDVFVYVSAGMSCLEAWSDEDLLFISSETGPVVIQKPIKIFNHCLEPVQITGLMAPGGSIPNTGNNQLYTNASNTTLMPDTLGEFTLTLSADRDWQGESTVILKGFGVNSLQEIDSSPLKISIKKGENVSTCNAGADQPCLSSDSQTIDVCGEGEGSKTIFWPKISQNNDCTQGYCDAKQLSVFLAEKLQQKIKEAKSRILTLSSSSLNLGGKCIEGYCTFGALGVKPESFEFYFQGDRLGTGIFENEIRQGKYDELLNPYIRESDEDITDIARSGFTGRTIIIPMQLKGCGRYTTKILGAVQEYNTELKPENIAIQVKLDGRRETTPECNNRIQNVMNFLPVDKGYDAGTKDASWAALIRSNSDLKDIAEDFGKALFETEKGRVVSSPSDNYIEFAVADLGQYILKIEIERKGAADEPKKVLVTINSNYNEASDEVTRKSIATEAGNIIRRLKNNKIDKGCISKNEDYFLISSVKDFKEEAALKLEGPKELKLYINKESCIDLNITTKIKTALDIAFNSSDFKSKAGITSIGLKKEKKDSIEEKISFEAGQLKLKGKDEKNKIYSASFQLCATADNEVQYADLSEVTVNIEGIDIEDHKITLKICGITPQDLYAEVRNNINNNAFKVGEKPYFATVGWNDNGDTLSLADIEKDYYDKHKDQDPQNVLKKEIKTKRLTGIGAYTAGCVAGVFATNAAYTVVGLGFGKIFWDLIFDCGLPAGVGAANEFGAFEGNSPLKPLKGIINFIGGGMNIAGKVAGVGGTETPPTSSGYNLENQKLDDGTGTENLSEQDLSLIYGTTAIDLLGRGIAGGAKKLVTKAEVPQAPAPAVQDFASLEKKINDLGFSIQKHNNAVISARKDYGKTLSSSLRPEEAVEIRKASNHFIEGILKEGQEIDGMFSKMDRTTLAAHQNDLLKFKKMLANIEIEEAKGGSIRIISKSSITRVQTSVLSDPAVVSDIENIIKAGGKPKVTALKEVLSVIKSPITRGILKFLGGQLGGKIVWNWYWKSQGPVSPYEVTSGIVKTERGVTSNVDGGVFEKNQTYKVSLKKDEKTGKPLMQFEKVVDLKDVDNERRLDDCDGKFLEQKPPEAKTALSQACNITKESVTPQSLSRCEPLKTPIETFSSSFTVDPLMMTSIYWQESKCNPNEADGGLCQLTSENRQGITTTEQQIRQCTKLYSDCLQNARGKGLSGEEATQYALFCFNRGQGTQNLALDLKYNQGKDNYTAMAEACYTYFKNGCGKLSAKDCCEGEGFGARYPEKVLGIYNKACSEIGTPA